MRIKLRCYSNMTRQWIEHFIISPNGKIYETSVLGDTMDIDEYKSIHPAYNDELILNEITKFVEVYLTIINE